MPISGGTITATSTVPVAANVAETNVVAAAAATQLLAANANRKGVHIFNNSTASLYISEGSAASLTNYDAIVPPGQYYEFPSPIYTGLFSGIWTAANGSAEIAELS